MLKRAHRKHDGGGGAMAREAQMWEDELGRRAAR
jgi:hypothetical protein